MAVAGVGGAVATVAAFTGRDPEMGAEGHPITEVVASAPAGLGAGAPGGEAAEAIAETGSYWCCSSLCVQHMGTSFGSVMTIVGIAAIVFGVLVWNPYLIGGGCLLVVGGVVVVYLSRKYVGLDIQVKRLTAQNERFERENNRLSQQITTLTAANELLLAQIETLTRENEEYGVHNDEHAALVVQERAELAEISRLLESQRRENADLFALVGSEREASAAQIARMRAAHEEVVAHLSTALTAEAAAHDKRLTTTAGKVDAAATRVVSVVERVEGATTSMVSAASHLATNSEAFRAKVAEVERLQAENRSLAQQLAALRAATSASHA